MSEDVRMITAETVRRLVFDAAGEGLCDACLAFACSASLFETRQVTEQLLSTASFHRSERCVNCRRTIPAIMYATKCTHCSYAVRPGDDALAIGSDIFHAACFKVLYSDESIRMSRQLHEKSLRLIEDARRQIRDQRDAGPPSSG